MVDMTRLMGREQEYFGNCLDGSPKFIAGERFGDVRKSRGSSDNNKLAAIFDLELEGVTSDLKKMNFSEPQELIRIAV